MRSVNIFDCYCYLRFIYFLQQPLASLQDRWKDHRPSMGTLAAGAQALAKARLLCMAPWPKKKNTSGAQFRRNHVGLLQVNFRAFEVGTCEHWCCHFQAYKHPHLRRFKMNCLSPPCVTKHRCQAQGNAKVVLDAFEKLSAEDQEAQQKLREFWKTTWIHMVYWCYMMLYDVIWCYMMLYDVFGWDLFNSFFSFSRRLAVDVLPCRYMWAWYQWQHPCTMQWPVLLNIEHSTEETNKTLAFKFQVWISCGFHWFSSLHVSYGAILWYIAII